MVKFIIARGIGFSPASTKWIPTLGFSIGLALVVVNVDGRAPGGGGGSTEALAAYVHIG